MISLDRTDDRTQNTVLHRVLVVGTTGSGKTTTARTIARVLSIPHIELDALYWEPNWTSATPQVFRARVAVATAGERWVVDGNYSVVRDLLWSRATTVVWLDYSLGTVLRQLFFRTVRRVVLQEHLWGTNRERFWMQFLSRESLFLWAVLTHRRRQTTYHDLTTRPEHEHIQVGHFHSPQETRRWLDRLPVALAR